MKGIAATLLHKVWRPALRRALAALPRALRFAIYRRLVNCDPAPDARLQVKIADTREELEACFALLHDAYVGSGFMQPHPSGLRITRYHALPTTTTICALWDGRVVGTISMVRDGIFGFPLQQAFDLAEVKARGGNVAEISALAVHRDFRATGGTILFPLLKYMYQYCTQYFDTRHLLIAVNPNRIEFYESLLFFERLREQVVDRYDFANGAPAIGATLDLQRAYETFRQVYAGKPSRRDLFDYFTQRELPNLQLPQRRYHTTNDPVLTPALLDHFFNRCLPLLAELPPREQALLHAVYDLEAFAPVLPPRGPGFDPRQLRRHQRFSILLPALLQPDDPTQDAVPMNVVEASREGFQAECGAVLSLGVPVRVGVSLGAGDDAELRAVALRALPHPRGRRYAFRVDTPDAAWLRCVDALEAGHTHRDLLHAG